jgi:hypothetical protein
MDEGDIRALILQRKHGKHITAAELWAQIPDVVPVLEPEEKMVRPIRPGEWCEPGTDLSKVFKILPEGWAELEKQDPWDWQDIFTFV